MIEKKFQELTENLDPPISQPKIWGPNVLGNTQKNLNNDQKFAIVGSMVETKQLSISQLKLFRQKPNFF